MSLFEENLGHSCHNGYCCFHLNELPMRKYIMHHLGVSQSPTGLAGKIGKALKDFRSKNVCPNFTAVPNPNFIRVLPEVVKSLSRDTKVFHELCIAVMESTCSKKLVETVMPGMNFSRWNILDICLLYLYMTLLNPPESGQSSNVHNQYSCSTLF
jgi:hypothetical protein